MNPTGKATFRWAELLDKWAIKPWFGQQKQAFDKKMKTHQRQVLASVSIDDALQSDGDDED
jgi:hypothetical protein